MTERSMMDEASSIFVDRLALEKILGEKLSNVCHRPVEQPNRLFDEAFDAFSHPLGKTDAHHHPEPYLITLQSPIGCRYPENRLLSLRFYPSTAQRGVILLVHGLYEDNRSLYSFFIGELNRLGYSVYLTTLPYHHERTPKEARFSGELFLSADLGRTKKAFIQSVLELRQSYEWIRAMHSDNTYIVGFSMGGTVAMAAAVATDNIMGLCVVNPAAMLFDVIWSSPLCATIKKDLIDAGWNVSDTRRVLASFDPFMTPKVVMNRRKILMIYALYDQITRPRQYESLISKWKLKTVIKYKAGHLNTLRVPRFAVDVARFFDQIEMKTVSPSKGIVS
jgi:pimeloyl-ACP methyl ester carboxylesterase